MSGLAGVVCASKKTISETENINLMTNAIKHRGRGKIEIKNFDCCVLGGVARTNSHQNPFSVCIDGNEYSICFDGLIYNRTELEHGLKVSENADDAEIVLMAYIRWGAGVLRKLSGIFAFAIWNESARELFIARDRFGIKPLYFTMHNGRFLFSSEIKGLLAHPDVDAVLDKTSICELIGLGPAQSQGCGVFKDINELLPAHCATFNKNGFKTYRYWFLTPEAITESFDECLEHTRSLTFDAINSQLEPKGRNLCFFLSGGLDSSAITALAARKFGEEINTFSLRYKGNDSFFTPTEYQPASDDYFIDQMAETFKTNHTVVEITNDDLFGFLTDAVVARDLPGMADIDSSLYFLCKKMGENFDGALSGECADEVFGGYPWFHRKEDFEANIFPWAKNTELRKNLISPDLINPTELEKYIFSKYQSSLEKTPRYNKDSKEEARRREIACLNLDWFMYSLGARSERIGMNCGLEIRMPFCDHKLAEYVFNIPWEFKAHNGREKGLLRMVFDDVLPEEILWRKKSPFPKTHNPEYEEMVRNRVIEIITTGNSPVCDLINTEYILDLMSKPSDYGKPWFGQLMATPQLYAYIIQMDFWLENYNIKIKI